MAHSPQVMKMFPSSFELLVMLVMTRISMVTTLFFAFLPLILYSYYSIISGVSHLGVSSLRGCFGVWVSHSITWRSFIYCISRFVHFSLTGSIILGPQVLKLNSDVVCQQLVCWPVTAQFRRTDQIGHHEERSWGKQFQLRVIASRDVNHVHGSYKLHREHNPLLDWTKG